MNYERFKVTLLERYDFTERGYCEKFREARLEGHKSPSQFIFRLKTVSPSGLSSRKWSKPWAWLI